MCLTDRSSVHDVKGQGRTVLSSLEDCWHGLEKLHPWDPGLVDLLCPIATLKTHTAHQAITKS